MYKTLYEELSIISELKTVKEKVEALLQHKRSDAFKILFIYAYSHEIKWLLPPGDPPYKAMQPINMESRFLNELRRLYLFVEGGNTNLTNNKRASLFIQLLESIDPMDAILLLAIKNNKMPFKGLNKKIAHQTFPELNLEGG